MSANGGDWRSAAFRQKVVLNIDEAIEKSTYTREKTAQEIEQHIFGKFHTRERYVTVVARVILALSALKKGKPTRSAEGLEDLCIKALNKLVKKNDIDELPLPECVKNSIKEKRTST